MPTTLQVAVLSLLSLGAVNRACGSEAPPVAQLKSLVVSADGRYLAVCTGGSDRKVWLRYADRWISFPTPRELQVERMEFSPDGDHLAISLIDADMRNHVLLWSSAAPAKAPHELRFDGGPLASAFWCASELCLGFSEADAELSKPGLLILDPRTNVFRHVLKNFVFTGDSAMTGREVVARVIPVAEGPPEYRLIRYNISEDKYRLID
jgi:hypothetical protein